VWEGGRKKRVCGVGGCFLEKNGDERGVERARQGLASWGVIGHTTQMCTRKGEEIHTFGHDRRSHDAFPFLSSPYNSLDVFFFSLSLSPAFVFHTAPPALHVGLPALRRIPPLHQSSPPALRSYAAAKVRGDGCGSNLDSAQLLGKGISTFALRGCYIR
jgi:hypothetical protein